MSNISILTFLSILLFFLFASSVSAQTVSTPSGLEQKNTAVSRIKEDTKALIQAKKDEFKLRLQTIKDQKKKALLERIDAKLENINKKNITRFSEVLTKLQTILDKIIQSTNDEKILAEAKIAQASLDAAKTAVADQLAKTYTMQITDESTLKLNAGAITSQLRQDLLATYKLVIDAKQKVQKLRTDIVIIQKGATNSANL